MFSLICVWINGWVNNGEAGDLRRHRTHYDVIVITRGWMGSLVRMTDIPDSCPGLSDRCWLGINLIVFAVWDTMHVISFQTHFCRISTRFRAICFTVGPLLEWHTIHVFAISLHVTPVPFLSLQWVEWHAIGAVTKRMGKTCRYIVNKPLTEPMSTKVFDVIGRH